MTASTVYSSTLYSFKGELYSCNRLPIIPIIVPQIDNTVARFLNIIKCAFGQKAEEYLQKNHQQTLQDLSSRSKYLFDIFKAS